MTPFEQEALTHLQNLIRINTANPPGNEIEAVRYLSQIFKKEGIPFQVFEPAPGRGNIIAQVKGSGQKRPLMLTSHLDVVPAEETQWAHHPYSGDVAEGCLWGRGAIDMKQMTVMNLMMMLAVARGEMQTNRDLLFVGVADEEAGCQWGSKWLVTNKPDLLNAEYALNEVGGFSLYVDGVVDKVFYPIGVAERGMCWMKVSADGDPGHGSLPHDRQAVVWLARIAAKLGENSFPFHSNPVVKKFIQTFAAAHKKPKSWVLRGLLSPFLNRFILDRLIPKDKVHQFRPMFSNTAAPTMFNAGTKVNVIPSHAELMIDGRVLPGQTLASFKKELESILGPNVRMEAIAEHEPVSTDYGNDMYRLLESTIRKHEPQAVCVPYLIPGFTDAAYFSRIGIKCYGFAPLKLPHTIKFSDMFHGHNERIPIDGFLWGLKVMADVVAQA